jgi:hypothetical protein
MLYVSIVAPRKAARNITREFDAFAVRKRTRENGRGRKVLLYAVLTKNKAYALMASAIRLGAVSAAKRGKRTRKRATRKRASKKEARFSSY